MTLPVRSRSRSVSGWDPIREMEQLVDRMSTLWDAGLSGGLSQWAPLADVEEVDDAYTVEIELPGVAREDVDIQLSDRQLTVTGEIKERERRGILHRQNRRVGSFTYSVTLPGDVDADGVSATLHDGLLALRVPKSAAAKPRRIEISG